VERICRALLRDRPESEDAAQQTFLSALRALGNGAEPREAEAWLGSIARNECLRRIRDRMREPLPTLEHELEDGRADIHRQAVSNLNAARLWQEIQALPDQQRDAIVLREFAGLSYDDLTVALGVSGGAVESLLFRARGTLRRRLRTALASLDLAGAASAVASALARIFAGGVAPVATKAAAVGAGAVVFSGGVFVGGDALLYPKAARPRTAVRQRVAVPAPASVAPQTARIVPVQTPSGGANGERSDVQLRSGDENSAGVRVTGGGESGDGESAVGSADGQSGSPRAATSFTATDGGGDRSDGGERDGATSASAEE
jgi:RNA polymerase sigma-70 factor (ECF subfamily)